MRPPAGKPSRQEVLDNFAVEPNTGRPTLERYLRDYPEFATELLDLSRMLAAPFTDDESPLSLEDQAKVDAAWLRHAAAGPAPVPDPFSALSVEDLREIARRLGVPRQVLMAFRNRRVILSTVPTPFLARLADRLSIAPEQLLRALSSTVFGSRAKPPLGPQAGRIPRRELRADPDRCRCTRGQARRVDVGGCVRWMRSRSPDKSQPSFMRRRFRWDTIPKIPMRSPSPRPSAAESMSRQRAAEQASSMVPVRSSLPGTLSFRVPFSTHRRERPTEAFFDISRPDITATAAHRRRLSIYVPTFEILRTRAGSRVRLSSPRRCRAM